MRVFTVNRNSYFFIFLDPGDVVKIDCDPNLKHTALCRLDVNEPKATLNNVIMSNIHIKCNVENCFQVREEHKLWLINSTVEGNFSGPCLFVHVYGRIVLDNVNIMKCGSPTVDGGALILSNFSSAFVKSSVFKQNTADSGACILTEHLSDLKVINSTFQENSADVPGIFSIGSTVHLIDSYFIENTNTNPFGDVLVFESSMAVITNTNFYNNRYGGLVSNVFLQVKSKEIGCHTTPLMKGILYILDSNIDSSNVNNGHLSFLKSDIPLSDCNVHFKAPED